MILVLQTNVLINWSMIRTDVWVVKGEILIFDLADVRVLVLCRCNGDATTGQGDSYIIFQALIDIQDCRAIFDWIEK